MNQDWIIRWGAGAAIVVSVALLVFLVLPSKGPEMSRRIPGTDIVEGEGQTAAGGNPVLQGSLVMGPGKAGTSTHSWPQFRGPDRTGMSADPTPLAKTWNNAEPKPLWNLEVGEGYAGPVIHQGRVYLIDYDREGKKDAFRCLSLDDGSELWRYEYPVNIKRNHGMSRTVPAIASDRVVGMGPLCHVLCLDAMSGELKWTKDLVLDYGTKVPPWYAGQCPLIEESVVVLAPSGPNVALTGLDLETGETRWETPNPMKWKMTHSSVMPMEFAGQRMFVYCGSGGVLGVSARDGELLWQTTEWKISMATVPSPVVLDDGRIFLSGGYGAGSLMLQLKEENGAIVPEVLYRLDPEVFGATQHTPILLQNHLYGIRPDGQFVCLDLNGNTVWASGAGYEFGLGPFLIAQGLVYAMDDSGKLSLMEATPAGFNLLAQRQVLHGRESWGPFALADGKLLARDLEELICLEVGQ